ncbi:MAG: hypothetical protein GWO38_18385, partial [Phycisphaerae bacterium]|nr:hypothetical protein [Phycisphaerae bacterium]NIW98075.1 hypothetical protein [Phycisphaerae bacterium]NIX29543.1 hypothetical protein [Phycisphaerae bacterium]
DAENGESFARGVLGVDYVFPNTLYVMLEYLYNGRIVPDTSSASIERSAEIITVGKNFIGFGFGYDLTPLARLKLTAIFDVDGKSRFLSPALSYNVIPDLYWTASAQLFGGGGGGPSDFGEVPKLYITSIEWYF